jgi:hypothetical protein
MEPYFIQSLVLAWPLYRHRSSRLYLLQQTILRREVLFLPSLSRAGLIAARVRLLICRQTKSTTWVVLEVNTPTTIETAVEVISLAAVWVESIPDDVLT